MSNKKEETPSKSRIATVFSTYRNEFAKIVWPSRPELIRKTITVAVISAMFGAYIAVLDGLLGSGFTAFLRMLG